MTQELDNLEQHLKHRSRKFLKMANLSICVIAAIIVIGVSSYFYGGIYAVDKTLELKKEKIAIINEVTDKQLKEIISEVQKQNLSKEKFYEILSQFRYDSYKMSRSISDIEKTQLLIITLAIGGVNGLIFIQAFLIDILESFYKYNKRLGTYFKGRADSAKFAGTTIIEEEETLAKFIAPDFFSFKNSLKNNDP